MLTNYHSHCNYCDGKESPEKYVTAAIQKGLIAFGFSSHAPIPFDVPWCMKQEDTFQYVNEINDLKIKYKKKIQIYHGLEVDFIPEKTGPSNPIVADLNLDFTIGSVHCVDYFPNGKPWETDNTLAVFLDGLKEIFNSDIKKAVSRYYELIRQMVIQEPFNIIGHLDKIKMHNEGGKFFSEKDEWYQKEVFKTLEVISASDKIIEVNTRGVYKNKTKEFYPSSWILEKVLEMNIPVTISSDAHIPSEIDGCFSEAADCLASLGFKKTKILLDGIWKDEDIKALKKLS